MFFNSLLETILSNCSSGYESSFAMLVKSLQSHNKTIYAAALMVLSACLVFSDLGSGLMPPIDDCYFAQKAKEMIRTGDWLTLRYAGDISLDHAPFYIWLIAVAFKLFGINEFAARFFSACFGMATIIAVYYLGKMLFDEWVGLFSSLVLLTTGTFFMYTRRAMFDVTFTFWVVLALIFFIKGLKQREYFLLFGASTGMAILTKSVIGFSPLLIAFAYLVLSREYKIMLDPFFICGHLVAAFISAPWFACQYINHRVDFVEGHIKWLLFKSAVEHENAIAPAWYVKQLLVVYWPWLPFALYAFIMAIVSNARRIDSRTLILLCWTIAIVGMMSCMKVRKIHYIMIAFPPLALFSAVALNGILARERIRHCAAVGILALLGCVLLVVMTTPVKLPPQLREDNYFENLVDDTHAVALFARDHFSQDEKILLYREWLWRIRSTYLFYSDRDISGSIDDTQLFVRTLKEGAVKYGLTTRENFRDLLQLEQFRPEILKATESLILFTTT